MIALFAVCPGQRLKLIDCQSAPVQRKEYPRRPKGPVLQSICSLYMRIDFTGNCSTLSAVYLGLNQAPGQGCCCCCPASRARLSPAKIGFRILGGSLSTTLLTACSKILPLLSTLKVEMPSKMPSASQGTRGTPWTVHRILQHNLASSAVALASILHLVLSFAQLITQSVYTLKSCFLPETPCTQVQLFKCSSLRSSKTSNFADWVRFCLRKDLLQDCA